VTKENLSIAGTTEAGFQDVRDAYGKDKALVAGQHAKDIRALLGNPPTEKGKSP